MKRKSKFNWIYAALAVGLLLATGLTDRKSVV